MSGTVFSRLISISILVVLFSGFWLRASNLEQYPPGISNDEAKNLIDSVYIAQTGRTPFYEDEGRPEPVNRIVAAVASLLYGNSIWAFRLTSAFWGLLAIAASYWTATQCFFDTDPNIRKLAGLFTAIALSVALGHLTVTRSLYRAVPLTFFMLMVIGFTARGLRAYKWRDFIWIGVFLALGIYTYTSGFIMPVAFPLVGLILLIFHRHTWRKWLPRLFLTGAILAILTSPIIYLLLTEPSSVLARASDVAESNTIEFSRKLELMIQQFFTEGDENPQYNVADAPVIAQVFIPFFFIGLGALVIRIRQPSSILIGGLFFLATMPVLLTDEITHGLRIYSEFAIIPLIISASVVLILSLIQRFSQSHLPHYIVLLIILMIGLSQVIESRQTYVNFWEDANTEWRKWRIYDRELTHNEWFFRSDRLALTNWIKAQNTPLLIPVEELTRDAQRGMLMSHFPYVDSVDDTFQIPDNTQIVFPWSLEKGDFLDDTTHFALVNNSTITLLPPLTQASRQSLTQNIDSAINIENPESNIPIVAKTFSASNDFELAYLQPTLSTNTIAVFNDELEVIQWYGSDTIQAGETYDYAINWSVNRPVSHEYGMFVQLLTQDWERITGVDDRLILRWLYPTIAWQPEQTIPDFFTLTTPDDLPTGTYRLATGVWYVNGGRMPAQSFISETVDNIATIGWLKVPQSTQPEIPDSATQIDAVLNDQFQLTHAEIIQITDKVIVQLYWKSLVHRPQIDATVFVQALDSYNEIVSQSDLRPWNGQYPTFIWDQDEVVMTEHLLEVADLERVQLIAGMYTQPDFTRLTAAQDGQQVPDNLIPLDLEQ